jgi:hypothetical protein
MALDYTNKALDYASRITQAARNLTNAIYAMQAVASEVAASGVILSDYDAAFAASGDLAYVDGATLTAALTAAGAIYQYGADNGYNDAIAKVAR